MVLMKRMNSALTREPSQYGNLPRTLGLDGGICPGSILAAVLVRQRVPIGGWCQIQEVDVCEETMINILRSAFAFLFFLSTFSAFGQTGIASHRFGDNTGEDWEPAILADGNYVYAFSPHYLATTYKVHPGAT